MPKSWEYRIPPWTFKRVGNFEWSRPIYLVTQSAALARVIWFSNEKSPHWSSARSKSNNNQVYRENGNELTRSPLSAGSKNARIFQYNSRSVRWCCRARLCRVSRPFAKKQQNNHVDNMSSSPRTRTCRYEL